MLKFFLKHWLYFAIGLAAVLLTLFLSGAFKRSTVLIDGMTPEAKQKYDAKEAESNQLRGENNSLRDSNEKYRAHVAELEVRGAVIAQAIDERGGAIEQKFNDIGKIQEKLKNEEAAINSNTDMCAACCSYSTEAIKLKLIAKPLDCRQKCNGKPCTG